METPDTRATSAKNTIFLSSAGSQSQNSNVLATALNKSKEINVDKVSPFQFSPSTPITGSLSENSSSEMVVEEIQERHDAVKEIERKLLDLHQIYLDMAVLVEAQGDLLDNIETQVGCAVDHVNMGTDALQTAKNLQKKSRKCMMIAIILLLIIAAIVVLSVIKPWKK